MQSLLLLTLAALSDLSYANVVGPTPHLTTHGRFPDPNSSPVTPHRKRAVPLSKRQAAGNGTCDTSSAPTTTAPKTNIWAGLSDEEAASVTAFLHDQQALNLTIAANATAWDNKILLVELLQPNKSDALSYLNGSGPAPARYARCQLKFGATLEPYLREYVVGPLPVPNGPAYTVPGVNTSASADAGAGATSQQQAGGPSAQGSGPTSGQGTGGGGGGGSGPVRRGFGPFKRQLNTTTGNQATLAELNWPYNKGEGYQRVFNQDQAEIALWTYNISMSIADLTQAFFNATVVGSPNDTFALAGNTPLLHEDDKIFQWNQFYQIHTGNCFDEVLLPTGFMFKADITGRDPSQWSVAGWNFNGIYYNTLDDLRAAMAKPDFVIPGPNLDGPWACTDWNNVTLPLDEKSPPVSVQPDGNRFKLDEEQNYVEWMDFSFYIASSRDRGVRIWDISFQGERIIYELGLEEALAHYASTSDPFQASNAYTDLEYGFGASAFQLVKGFDCPSHATFLNQSFYGGETSHIHPDSMCIFEYDPGYPMQRHTAPSYVSVSKNLYLTVRSAATVGNYDYMIDYHFFLDGSIHTSIRASGYIQSSFWPSAGAPEDGFHIHDHLAGSMHEHVLQFKLDLDVAGEQNSVMKMGVKPVSQTYPWSNGKTVNSMTFFREFVENEDQSKIDWPNNMETMYSIVNKDAVNEFGEYKGYKITPGSADHNRLTIEDSTLLGPSAGFAHNHLNVLVRHDNEPHTVYPYNAYDPYNPVVDFDKFYNSESLDQEDLVVYFNLGMHHIPDQSDLPNTVYTQSHSSMMFVPQNYVLGDPSRRSRHGTRINAVAGVVTDAETFGVVQATCAVPMEVTAPNEQTWVGEVYISKFPFLPDSQMIGNPGDGLAAALS